MYSNTNYIETACPANPINEALELNLDTRNFQGYLLIEVFPDDHDFLVIKGCRVKPEPFNGGEKDFLRDVLNSCFSKHPKPHYHSISNFALSNRIRKFCTSSTKSNRLLFYPFTVLKKYFILIGFLQHDSKKKLIDTKDKDLLSSLVTAMRASYLLSYNDGKIAATEMYIKEIGHDIASSAQAILGKLNTIARGIHEGENAKRKAKEAADEVKAIVRVSDSIGVTIDENYQVQQVDEFDMVDAIYTARERHYSEANELHITIKTDFDTQSCPYVGDPKAIEIAFGHYILNAIKYSYGSSDITFKLKTFSDSIKVSVINRSKIGLPARNEEYVIWDFGYRSDGAMEAHVNGSGIGLFTARKIVSRHFGKTNYTVLNVGKKVISFNMIFPSIKEARRLFSENLMQRS